MYRLTGSLTDQLGGDIYGGNQELSGNNIALSKDGKRIAISTPTLYSNEHPGLVRVYELNTNNEWSLLGAAIRGDNPKDCFGQSIAMDDTGNILLVGAVQYDIFGQPSTKNGYIAFWKYENNTWTKQKQFYGSNSDDGFGHSVSLSPDGKHAAASAVAMNRQDGGYVVTYTNMVKSKVISSKAYYKKPDLFYTKLLVKISSDGKTLMIGPRSTEGVTMYDLEKEKSVQVQLVDSNSDIVGYTMDALGKRLLIMPNRDQPIHCFELFKNVWTRVILDTKDATGPDYVAAVMAVNSDATLLVLGKSKLLQMSYYQLK